MEDVVIGKRHSLVSWLSVTGVIVFSLADTAFALEAGTVRLRETDGMVMVYVPAGRFQMGYTNRQVLQILGMSHRAEREDKHGRDENDFPSGEETLVCAVAGWGHRFVWGYWKLKIGN